MWVPGVGQTTATGSFDGISAPAPGDLHFPITEAPALRTLVQSPKDPDSSGLLHLVLAVLAALFRAPKLHDGSGDAKDSKQSHVCWFVVQV